MRPLGKTGEILRDLAKWASIVVDPREMQSNLRELIAQSPGPPLSHE